ncbi:DUF3349 domain-containing protein [Cellulomonas sp. McL0617]|uniref:DUF3349 domain-containing protein n=1 Tax=Cellulomonas sp. McL0617 TaxID=3415675 RepID=UPI003CF942BB
MARANAVRRVADWLREGYPTGVPEQDYVALLALLRRKLTEEEVEEVTDRIILLHPDGGIPPAVVGEQIGALLDQEPHESDVARVSARLAAVGWPLAEIDD